MPARASCHAASLPASPPPMTETKFLLASAVTISQGYEPCVQYRGVLREAQEKRLSQRLLIHVHDQISVVRRLEGRLRLLVTEQGHAARSPNARLRGGGVDPLSVEQNIPCRFPNRLEGIG